MSARDDDGRLRIGAPVAAGVAAIVLFFGGFGGWAALAPLESAAIAPGVVSVASSRKTVQHLEGGIVGEILVEDGDRVRAGEVLIRLDETRARASLDLLQGRRRAAAALEARLIAERDGHDRVRFPDWLADRADDPEVAATLDGERRIFEARRETLAGQIAVLERRIAQFDEEIAGLEAEIAAEDAQLELIAEELDAVTRMVDKGLERKPRLLALKRRQAEIEGGRGRNLALIARARQNIGEARLRIAELKTQRMNEVVAELRAVQTTLFDLADRIRAAEDVLRRTEIRALQDGTVVGLQVHTPGGVIAPGEPLLDIVPRGDRLIVEARVDPKDIDVVDAGLPAKVRLTALDRRTTPPLDGRVVSVSADSLADERTGNPYYLARVALMDETVPGGDALYPGMQAEVMIVTGARTALDYLLAPVARSMGRALRED